VVGIQSRIFRNAARFEAEGPSRLSVESAFRLSELGGSGPVQTVNYGEFSLGVHGRFSGQRAPIDVSIEVTRRCPLECLHCYNNLPMGDVEARKGELSFAEHVALLDELVEAGTLWILYSGGEIFARKDFLDIYTEAKKRGFLVTLFTNGTLINERIADHLARYRPFAIEITLYGATRETYEKLTQKPGSFDRCMRGIQLLLERGLPLKLKTVPTTVNQHEVYAMKEMAASLGVEFKFDPLVNPRIDCSQSPLAVRLTPEEVVGLEFYDATRKEEYRRLVTKDLCESEPASSSADDSIAGKQRYSCGGGVNGCAVSPSGKMSICVISQQQGYDIRSGSFREGWNGKMHEIRVQERTRRTICDGCKISSLCSMCPANGELENGDPEAPVEFLCQVAHLRAYALGYAVPGHDTADAHCANCAGGANHGELLEAAARIESTKREFEITWESRPAASAMGLNIFQPAAQGGGCRGGGCTACPSVHG
jgi:radical SAM protein with 4Fe4S-binding SPASM domain